MQWSQNEQNAVLLDLKLRRHGCCGLGVRVPAPHCQTPADTFMPDAACALARPPVNCGILCRRVNYGCAIDFCKCNFNSAERHAARRGGGRSTVGSLQVLKQLECSCDRADSPFARWAVG